MSEDQGNSVEEAPDTDPHGPRGGERLAAARREQQISVLEVAKELHLDEPKVRALERNDFDVLGAPVFAKGHLRKYAQLVGVDEDDVFADYYQMTRSEGIPPVVITSRPRVRQELSPGPWIAVIIVIIVAAASYWWFAVQSETVEAPQTSPEELPQPGDAVGNTTSEAESVVVAAVLPEEQAVPDIDQPQPEPVAQIADGESRLSLSYTGDCWTEISDATGRRLFFDMGRDGRSVELTGEAPFAVLLGNVDNVDVKVNDTDYPVSMTNPGSRTARLTITNP